MDRREILLNNLVRTQEKLKDQISALKRLQKRRRQQEQAADTAAGTDDLGDDLSDLIATDRAPKATNHPAAPHPFYTIKLNQGE